ncbi:uncharacterized protein [Antedon mediterranea]|uniref:uncharacterized protein n=1 Tax=Antedon mediterranea TaxID=105859 RepID=UPI003AF75141
MLQTTIVRTKSINADSSLEDDIKPLPEVCKKVLHFLKEELKVFSQKDARGLEERMYIPCAFSTNIENAHMHLIRKFDKDELPCGSNKMEVKLYRKLFGEDVLPKANQQSQEEALSSKSHNEGYVDDQTIKEVSEKILGWKQFGVRLGLGWCEVKNRFGSEMTTNKSAEEMMMYWRTNNRNLIQLEEFCRALVQHGRDDLANSNRKHLQLREMEDKRDEEKKQADSFDDQDMLFICDKLDSRWTRLTVRLGIQWFDLNNIRDNNKDIKDSMMDALVGWRDRNSENQITKMVDALRQQKLVKLSNDLCTRHVYQHKEGKVIVFTEQLKEGRITDLGCLMISEKMDERWKDFCCRLSIDNAELHQIEAKFPKEIVESTIEALVQWRENQESSLDQWEKIREILKEMEKMHIVDELEGKRSKRKAEPSSPPKSKRSRSEAGP